MGVAVSTIEVTAARRWRDFDWQLTLYLVLLIGFGIVLGASAMWNETAAPGAVPQPVKTVIWTVLGLSLMVVAASVDYHWLRTFAVPIYVFTLGLLVVNLLVGTSVSGDPGGSISSSARARRMLSRAC